MANVDLTVEHRARVEALRKAMLEIADGWKGTPYVFGGNSTSGIDCSHFVYQVLNVAREKVYTDWNPQLVDYRSTSTIENSGLFFPVPSPFPGDLILWDGHVGIIRNPNSKTFIGAQTSTGVADASYDTGYWAQREGKRFRRFVHFF